MVFSSPASAVIAYLMTSLALTGVTKSDYGVSLEHMTSVKVPTYTEEGERLYNFDSGAVRKMSYHANRKLLYVAGGPQIHYINVSNPQKLRIIGHTALPDVEFYDVKTCGDHVIATFTRFNGSGLLVAKGYHPAHNFPVILLDTLYDVSEPVSLSVTSDCQTAVVAVNGKASFDGKEFVDHQPAVLLISLPAILARDTTEVDPVVVLDFRELDSRSEELEAQGIRFPMKGRVGRLSQDLDPSYVAIDDVTRKAYVTLMANNAVMEIDLDTKNVTRVTSLGLKDWRDMDIDVCDQDGVRFQRYPIYSMFQPGAISIARHSGATYLLTANTGAKRDYSHIIGWTEAMNGLDLVKNDLIGSSVEPDLVDALRNETQLGSLHFTTMNGLDDLTVNKMTKFLAFGARSFSIRTLPDLDLVYDSGSDVELRMAEQARDVFNCPVKEGHNVVRYDRDLTSVGKGPAPVSLTWGKMSSLTLVFVGLHNPGGVLLYSLPLSSDSPRFESLWLGVHDALRSWDELYVETALAGVGVSDMIFVPQHVTGSAFPWLLVAGSKSGTVTLLKVKGTGDIPAYSSSTVSSHLQDTAIFFVLVICALLYTTS